MIFIRSIGIIWMIAPFLMLFSSENHTLEMAAFGSFSFILGLLLFKYSLKRNPTSDLKNVQPIIVETPPIKPPEPISPIGETTEGLTIIKQPIVKPEIDTDSKKLKKIGFIPSTIFAQVNPYSYPVVKMPVEDSFIKFPKKGRTNKLGFTENKFYIYLKKYFEQNFSVYNDRHITHRSGTTYYEPDFLIISEKDNKNIFIDIEIDEPYEGLSRIPTHELNRDTFRDNFFTKRGYIVIRFTEKQIFEEPIQCCIYIAEIIKSIDSTYENCELKSTIKISIYEQWDTLQAKKWAREKYREKYLGISNFGIRELNEYEFSEGDTSLDELVEAEINDPNPIITIADDNVPLIGNKPHNRDKRIVFDAINHRYYVDGNADTISVSQLVDKFFPEFDSVAAASKLNPSHELHGLPIETIIKKWKDKGIEAAELGTKLHLQIENYYKNFPVDNNSIEYEYFLKFKEKYSTMIPHRTEWRIFDEDYLIAGTIDMIYKKDDGSYYMFDWKRSEKVVNKDGSVKTSDPSQYFTRYACGNLNHLTDDSYYKYALQQNIYCYILENKYGYRISSLNLLILHPNYDTFHWIKLPNMKNEVEYMFSTLKMIS
ncbi:hypothetical protein IWX84_001861 [Flavobacterium sp. CG_9.10]|uniref:hypothetical protein n=1 Tax=Flavobacterium sp. CG_9.10 TaxID=2787729 RepID=UPI0018CB2567|nr:hypothetical protein [Flavobacterium sp. CG_9.10]MBG6110979.1 hypothetical protein [Flavobacterium sp. CG_9.10]